MRIAPTVFAGLALLAATSANAFEIDFSQSIRYHGTAIPLCEAPKDAPAEVLKRCALPLTLGSVVSQALDAPEQKSETPLSGDEKLRRGLLANKVWGAEKLDISPEDQVLMKTAVGKMWPAAVVSASWPLIDPSVLAKKP